MQPKPVEAAAQPEQPERDRDYHTRISNAVSNSIFSLGDMFRDGQKGVRFPKDLIKVLEQKLQDIAMGRDSAYVTSLLLFAGGGPYQRGISGCHTTAIVVRPTGRSRALEPNPLFLPIRSRSSWDILVLTLLVNETHGQRMYQHLPPLPHLLLDDWLREPKL